MAKKIGPALIFDRLRRETGIGKTRQDQLSSRKFAFDVERAVFLTVLHRLFVSGSDRECGRWRRDYLIEGADGISLHHLYRTMAYRGEEIENHKKQTSFSPRCTKDVIEEDLFRLRQDPFTSPDLVFFDTTPPYFEGTGPPSGEGRPLL